MGQRFSLYILCLVKRFNRNTNIYLIIQTYLQISITRMDSFVRLAYTTVLLNFWIWLVRWYRFIYGNWLLNRWRYNCEFPFGMKKERKVCMDGCMYLSANAVMFLCLTFWNVSPVSPSFVTLFFRFPTTERLKSEKCAGLLMSCRKTWKMINC